MDVVRLRKLTTKSVLGFGKYQDSTVGHLLGYNQTTYLRWVYYNCSNIDFAEDILDLIHVSTENRIAKPGKAPEIYERVYQEQKEKCFGLNLHIRELKRKKRARVKARLCCMNNNLSKAALRSFNQWK